MFAVGVYLFSSFIFYSSFVELIGSVANTIEALISLVCFIFQSIGMFYDITIFGIVFKCI